MTVSRSSKVCKADEEFSNSSDPRSFANALQDTGVAALKAIEAKDTEALSSAGGDIDMACESCHTRYWYPNKKPS